MKAASLLDAQEQGAETRWMARAAADGESEQRDVSALASFELLRW